MVYRVAQIPESVVVASANLDAMVLQMDSVFVFLCLIFSAFVTPEVAPDSASEIV